MQRLRLLSLLAALIGVALDRRCARPNARTSGTGSTRAAGALVDTYENGQQRDPGLRLRVAHAVDVDVRDGAPRRTSTPGAAAGRAAPSARTATPTRSTSSSSAIRTTSPNSISATPGRLVAAARLAAAGLGYTLMLISRQDISGGAPVSGDPAARLAALRQAHRVLDLHPDAERRHQPRQHPLRLRRESRSIDATAMNVLVVGGGGREHALAWKLAQSPRVAKVFVAPGNAGTALRARAHQRPASPRFAELVAFAQNEPVALTVVGPEGPLAAGIVDAFRAARAARSSARRRPRRSSRARRTTPRRSWRGTAFRPRNPGRSPTPRAARAYVARARRADRRQGGRPRRGQGRGRRGDAWRRRTRRSTRCSSATCWARPARASSSRTSSPARRRASS